MLELKLSSQQSDKIVVVWCDCRSGDEGDRRLSHENMSLFHWSARRTTTWCAVISSAKTLPQHGLWWIHTALPQSCRRTL